MEPRRIVDGYKRIVFTNGCFDLFHAGHAHLLKSIKEDLPDDYELVVRTFLHTKMCRIPNLCYIQYIYNNAGGQNTHNLARADIQRRVRTIMYYYNEQIKDRFEELGLYDWAYYENPNAPLHVQSKFGEEEQVANITYVEGETLNPDAVNKPALQETW